MASGHAGHRTHCHWALFLGALLPKCPVPGCRVPDPPAIRGKYDRECR